MAPPSKYTPEFREEAVQIALRSSKTISETAREMDLNTETLRGWVKKYKQRNEPPADAELTLSERASQRESYSVRSRRFSLRVHAALFEQPGVHCGSAAGE